MITTKDDVITIGKKHKLESKILGEEREYWVHLPASYEDPYHAPQSFPVLYLLDGDWGFHSVTGVLNFMGGALQTPEFIIVAIPNTDRTRDLTPTHTKKWHQGKEEDFLENSGGGDAFLQFIKEELFPKIELAYRTRPCRLLVGHSFGGLLALHALLNEANMFQAFVAIDPYMTWDDEVLTRQARQMLSNGQKLKSKVYMSLANNTDDGMDTVEEKNRKFASLLESFSSPEFHFKFQYFKNEVHHTVPLQSLYHGLLFIFEDFRPDFVESYKNPTHLQRHFELASESIGLTFKPPEGFVNGWGLYLLNDRKDLDKAFEAFEMNATNYPNSYNVYKSLAEAYEVEGDKQEAIRHYEKALSLNPDVQEVKDQLRNLQEV